MDIIKLFFFLHIIFMTLGAVFMIKAFLIIKSKEKKGFGVHQKEGMYGVIFAIMGLISSFTFIQLSSELHFKSPHSIFGLITLVLLVITAILAIMFGRGYKKAYKLHRHIARISFVFFLLTYLFGILIAISI